MASISSPIIKVAIVIINNEDDKQKAIANALYNDLNRNNIDVLLDDRDERVR